MLDSESPSMSRAEAIEQALGLSQTLEEFIAQNLAEYKKLPFFAKPIARNFFHGKSGQSMEDWQQTAADLTALLRRMQSLDASAEQEFAKSYHALRPKLVNLIGYCQEVPGEMARFNRDPEMLRSLRQYMGEREEQIEGLMACLDAVHALS